MLASLYAVPENPWRIVTGAYQFNLGSLPRTDQTTKTPHEWPLDQIRRGVIAYQF
jgi:hypothetical protein